MGSGNSFRSIEGQLGGDLRFAAAGHIEQVACQSGVVAASRSARRQLCRVYRGANLSTKFREATLSVCQGPKYRTVANGKPNSRNFRPEYAQWYSLDIASSRGRKKQQLRIGMEPVLWGWQLHL